MPFTIHEEAAKKQLNWNISRPQEAVPEVLPQNFAGTMGGGLPVKHIPHMEFPRVVYLHPNEPFEEIQHKNDRHEIVSTELVATEHLTKTVNDETELTAALEEGWVKEPYIPKAAPKTPGLYGPKKKVGKAA